MSAHATQPREPRGRPTGGRWSEKELGASGLLLQDTPEFDTDLYRARREALAAGGYMPGVATRAVISPETTSRREDWWDSHFLQAEYGSGDGYPQMPDDYTPGGTAGRALSGKRRTHRMKYTAGGVQVRMPSRTAIARYSDENNGDTFDVPVSASVPGGDVQGWVRVTRTGPGQWHATGVGFPEHTGDGVAEAVAATMEGRETALAPQNFGDLIERRKQRMNAENIVLQDTDSSWISSIGYDSASGIMATMTSAGKVYGHRVPEDVFQGVRGASSPGAVFNKTVKGRPGVQLQRCENCGRYGALSGEHRCPAQHKPGTGSNAHAGAARARALQVAGRETAAYSSPAPQDSAAPAREQTIDLGALLKQRADNPRESGTTAQDGPRGWTARVADDLQPFTSSTYAPHAYSQGTADQPSKRNGDDGAIGFEGVGEQAASSLAEQLPEGAASRRTGQSPTAGTMLNAAAQHPGTVEVGGYLIGPDRSDEHLGLDTALIFDDELAKSEDAGTVLRAAKDTYGLHDATQRPTTLELVEVPWRPGEKAWRLWWL